MFLIYIPMIADLHPALMGPHAIESYKSRMLALEEFGVNPLALMLNEQTRAVVKRKRSTRALALEPEHDLIAR